mgnify:FL=1
MSKTRIAHASLLLGLIVGALIAFYCGGCATLNGVGTDLRNMANGMAQNMDEPSRIKVNKEEN